MTNSTPTTHFEDPRAVLRVFWVATRMSRYHDGEFRVDGSNSKFRRNEYKCWFACAQRSQLVCTLIIVSFDPRDARKWIRKKNRVHVSRVICVSSKNPL